MLAAGALAYILYLKEEVFCQLSIKMKNAVFLLETLDE